MSELLEEGERFVVKRESDAESDNESYVVTVAIDY